MATPASVIMAGLPGWFAEPVDRRWSAPVLLVHGSFSHHQHFGNYLNFFATEGFDAYAVSLRGRLGVAPEKARGLRFRHYFEDLLRIVGEFPTEPILIGHSLGALLALKVAELGRCSAAVLLNPAPPGMLTAQPRSLTHFAPLLPSIALGRPFRPSASAFRQLAFNRLPDSQFANVVSTMVEESGLVFQEMMTGAIRVDTSRLASPILCIGGTEDRVISRRLLRLTADRSGAEIKEYPEHGHWIHGEPGWNTIAHGIAAWLADRCRQRRLRL
jgi:pimeloyl-ACP methyl ester carboxylesterase